MQSNAPVISNEAFHGLFGRITDALDPYTEGSKVGVMVSLMSAYSAYIGYGPTVETGKGSSPLALWGVLVGRSGVGRKGTATGIARRVVDAAFASFAEESVVEGLPATGLGFITELADRAEGTLANPVWFIEEEGDALLSNARRDAKVGVYLRKAFDAQTIAHKTKMDDLRVRRPHLGLTMHVQPRNWAAVAGGKDATGGTWNRLLPVWVQQSKTLPVFESSDAHEAIRQAARALRQAGDYARQVDTVTVPGHVARVFEAKHRPIVEAMISTEAMSQYAERAMAYMIRLAGLFALSERRDEISERDFDAALALVCYSIETIAYVLPEAEASEEASLAVKVENFVREAGPEGRTATEIYRALNIKAADLREIVAQLDTIEVVKGHSAKGTGGRPSMRYLYVDAPTAEETNELVEETPEILTKEPAESRSREEEAVPVAETPAFLPFLSDDEWDEIDAAESNTPEPEPVAQAVEEPTVSEEAVKAFLSSPAGAEMLQEIVMSMMAKQAAAATPEAGTASKARAPRRGRAKSSAEALFQAPEVAA
ncbi:YfjI family protein [Nonomuraea roseoviolacea]|uniref:DUF3987 domain-containing protein n=1 Tax=Nonomuraea roseoviolacea subsp. carminata TaxID=160689 RepID=A0ABT1KF93_9ACTN|nr:YfjI family protein [Nonomuraea roseoviolacea]MCP2352693.1 hypothetical protein [Nonomuraea roseoviolacea subsp. carminata]